MPEGAAVARTSDVMRQIEKIALKTDGVEHAVAISGQSILLGANASNFGTLYLMLKPFAQRRDREVKNLSAEAITARLQDHFPMKFTTPTINISSAPPHQR